MKGIKILELEYLVGTKTNNLQIFYLANNAREGNTIYLLLTDL